MLLRRISVIAVLMLALGGAVAFAGSESSHPQKVSQNSGKQRQNQNNQNGNSAQRRQPRWMKDMNLSSEQMQKIQEIRNEYKDQIAQSQQQVRQSQTELGELMAGTASEREILTKHRQVQDLTQALAEVRFKSMLAMREVLNPEQRRQFAEQMKNRRENSPSQQRNGKRQQQSEEIPVENNQL